MDTQNTKAAVAQGTLETRDLDVMEQASNALWGLIVIGLIPCIFAGPGWFKESWPLGVPTTALAIYATREANKKREEIATNYLRAINEKLGQ